ncbi:hypothetical protein [Plantactinospora sp. KBS50]|uniref:hypothetical protein n=1 Tax=Plantactinospora sp. KBS50 TaxID=2024580 RepID=UPI0012FD93B0|nr:hypothetical protein [Plantactinospora sp. KBS50]
MIDPGKGEGGSPGSTDWASWDVAGMWRMLAGQDTAAQWRQVAGWRRTCELVRAHLVRLRQHRDRLAAAWPPERSAAARTYLDRLDQLIASVAQTHDAATANFAIAAAAAGAIDAARTDLKKIYDEYAPKRRARDTFDRQAAALATVGYQPWRLPPVSDAELAALDVRARTVLAGLSGELVQAQAQLRQPPTYRTRPAFGERNDPDVYRGTSPPPIPSIVPVPTGPARAARRVTAAPSGGAAGATAAGASRGPVLGGVQTAPPGQPGGPGTTTLPATPTGPPGAPPLGPGTPLGPITAPGARPGPLGPAPGGRCRAGAGRPPGRNRSSDRRPAPAGRCHPAV